MRRPGSQIRSLLICAISETENLLIFVVELSFSIIRLVVTSELARRCFSAETEGELTLGSPAAFAAGSVWRGNRAKQSNTPSVSRQKQAADTSLREGGKRASQKLNRYLPSIREMINRNLSLFLSRR